MAEQAALKKTLSELSKREDLKNRVCCDCGNPNPQWASLSFAIFICLQCAGTHRGFGVHISFVRSISMDTWQEDQVKRMQLGGNLLFKEFIGSYVPPDQGGYKEGATSYDTYHCWAATQYREKLDMMVAGKQWSPSAPPADFKAGSRTASPAPGSQALRKSRASARGGPLHSATSSPAPSLTRSRTGTPNPAVEQKTANENYFANLGRLNETRSEDLPPSQGGRYTGFGNTPTPPPSQHPSLALSSANAPTLSELQENPVAALSKGWSLFAAAVAGATKVVNESVIQPGVEKVTDPNFQANVRGYMTDAQKTAAMVGSTANDWSKQQFGIDVADTVGVAVGGIKDRVAGPAHSGYGQVALTSPNDLEESHSLYHDDDDLFTEYRDSYPSSNTAAVSTSIKTDTSTVTKNARTKPTSDWDDDWKDF